MMVKNTVLFSEGSHFVFKVFIKHSLNLKGLDLSSGPSHGPLLMTSPSYTRAKCSCYS